jgi:hypothetical protein
MVAHLRKVPRYVVSKNVQSIERAMLLGGACFQSMNVQTSYECSCEELESIAHFLKDCVLREHIRDILRKVSPTLEEKALLGTAKGLKVTAEFMAEDLKRRLADHAWALTHIIVNLLEV